MRRVSLALVLVAATVGGVAVVPEALPAGGTAPSPAAAAIDCAHWRYGPADEPGPGVLPTEFDRTNYKRTSLRDPNPALISSPHNLCGQQGVAADLAWGVQTGRPDVVIAVLDSGIKWRDPSSMADLATQIAINPVEAPPPCGSVHPDCNGDGRFDIRDYGPIPDLNGNGIADPEDLILDPKYNNGVDDDHNGYVDDIAGWDFLYNDNDPLDTVDYGHGTGEAEDSTAASNGVGNVGTCFNCRVLPVRVSDSFVADGQRFAAGVLFALDNGASVVQEALGAISNPSVAQRAIDAAYHRNVVVVASMADEASKHPNLPAALDHTMAVNSVTKLQSPLGGPVNGYLALNGCTNYGGHTFVSVESGACSSEATGISSGVVGLIESESRALGRPLSANEVMQIVRVSADDVDFSTPNSVDPANDFGTPPGGILNTVRYPTTPGWDATFGYGRLNAYEAVKMVRDGRIPPEADITDPQWFSLLPTHGTVTVRGHVAAPHATSYDYRVEWAAGLQPPDWPATDQWHVVNNVMGATAPVDGVLAHADLASIAAALPNGGQGAPLNPDGTPNEERFSVRMRVVVTAHGGGGDALTGIDQQQVFVHDDPALAAGFPRRVAGASTASPAFADINGDGHNELVLGTDDGAIHAWSANGHELPGFPVHTDPAPFWHAGSPTAMADGIGVPDAPVSLGAPVITDLDGNGHKEVVAADLDGRVYVWDAHGRRRAGFPQQLNPAYSRDLAGEHDQFNRTKPLIYGAPVAADLDGNGTKEIIVAAGDRHVYAWHPNGTAVAGFPVLVVDPAEVQSVDPISNHVTFTPTSGVTEGGELTATPAVGDINGDGHPDIVIGAQEAYAEPVNIGDGAGALGLISLAGTLGNTRLYAIDGHGHFLAGWPAKLGMFALESLPTIGDGVSAQAAIGDVIPGGTKEVVAAAAVGPVYVLNAQGHSVYGQVNGLDLPLAWAGELDGSGLPRFGANRTSTDTVLTGALFSGPSLGRLDGAGGLDPAITTAGLTRLLDIQVSDLQLPNDDQLTAWHGTTGNMLAGSPHTVSDMAFFVTPAIADVSGDGRREIVAGNGLYLLDAVDADGHVAAGWPKLTGGWEVGTPAVGDWNGDGRSEVAVVRRDGVLIVWHTPGRATAVDWGRFGGNDQNTATR